MIEVDSINKNVSLIPNRIFTGSVRLDGSAIGVCVWVGGCVFVYLHVVVFSLIGNFTNES